MLTYFPILSDATSTLIYHLELEIEFYDFPHDTSRLIFLDSDEGQENTKVSGDDYGLDTYLDFPEGIFEDFVVDTSCSSLVFSLLFARTYLYYHNISQITCCCKLHQSSQASFEYWQNGQNIGGHC